MARGPRAAKESSSESEEEEEPASNTSSSEEEEADRAVNDQVNEEEDEEELEAVARTADDSDEEENDAANGGGEPEDDDDEEGNAVPSGVAKRERERLREMQRLKKQKIQDILDKQNAEIDADMNNRGKGRLKFLLQQTELFAHFAKGEQSASLKKTKGRGRHASKVTEEEEDQECLKEEEDGLSGNTRLVAQPSCNNLFGF